jgi:hypothetical protein
METEMAKMRKRQRFKVCAGPLHEILEDRIQDGQTAKVMMVGHM